MPSARPIFITNLRKLLQKTGWSQRRLAKEAGLTPAQVSNYLGGHAMPSFDALEKLAQAFGVVVMELFSGQAPEPRIERRAIADEIKEAVRDALGASLNPAQRRIVEVLTTLNDPELDADVLNLVEFAAANEESLPGENAKPEKRRKRTP